MRQTKRVSCYIVDPKTTRTDVPEESEGVFRWDPQPGEKILFSGQVKVKTNEDCEIKHVSLSMRGDGNKYYLEGEQLVQVESRSDRSILELVEKHFSVYSGRIFHEPSISHSGTPVTTTDDVELTIRKLHRK
jgi:hypothetical protein